MKKIILMLSLVAVSLTSIGQSDEFIRVYSQWRVLDGETFDVIDSNFEVTIITFNAEGGRTIKIERQDSDPISLYQIGEVEEDKDDNGNQVQTVKTISKDGSDILFSFFEDSSKGVLLVFEDDGKIEMVNFYN